MTQTSFLRSKWPFSCPFLSYSAQITSLLYGIEVIETESMYCLFSTSYINTPGGVALLVFLTW